MTIRDPRGAPREDPVANKIQGAISRTNPKENIMSKTQAGPAPRYIVTGHGFGRVHIQADDGDDLHTRCGRNLSDGMAGMTNLELRNFYPQTWLCKRCFKDGEPV